MARTSNAKLVFGAFTWLAQIFVRGHLLPAIEQKTRAKVTKHSSALVRKREQLVRQDAYGKPLLNNWMKEISYFINEHIRPDLTPEEQLALGVTEQAQLAGTIYLWVEVERQKNSASFTFNGDMTPEEFERFCAEQLRRVGWRTHVTTQSRDQGVDVIAEKGGCRVVIQCKLYSQPVGNKAVQEITAARAHEQANYGHRGV
jgi:restriction system protein